MSPTRGESCWRRANRFGLRIGRRVPVSRRIGGQDQAHVGAERQQPLPDLETILRVTEMNRSAIVCNWWRAGNSFAIPTKRLRRNWGCHPQANFNSYRWPACNETSTRPCSGRWSGVAFACARTACICCPVAARRRRAPDALGRSTQEVNRPLLQAISTSRDPRAQRPFTRPVAHSLGSAGSNWISPV